MKKLVSLFFVQSSLALADAGDIGGKLQEATENVKQWGTDAMLLVMSGTVAFALITKYYCPRWLERARDHAWVSVGLTLGLYIVFFFFGDVIKDAVKENLNFWNWFGL